MKRKNEAGHPAPHDDDDPAATDRPPRSGNRHHEERARNEDAADAGDDDGTVPPHPPARKKRALKAAEGGGDGRGGPNRTTTSTSASPSHNKGNNKSSRQRGSPLDGIGIAIMGSEGHRGPGRRVTDGGASASCEFATITQPAAADAARRGAPTKVADECRRRREPPPASPSLTKGGPGDERLQALDEGPPTQPPTCTQRRSGARLEGSATAARVATGATPQVRERWGGSSPRQRAAADDDDGTATDGSRTIGRIGPIASRRSAVAIILVAAVAVGVRAAWSRDAWEARGNMGPGTRHRHILPPRRRSALSPWRRPLPRAEKESGHDPHVPRQGNLTLRHVLSDPAGYHLAMAPAFFGFYGYLGALAAWEDEVGRRVLEPDHLLSVAGASAGAMTAVLLSALIPPRIAATFVSTMTLDKFADFPGIFAAFRGNKFEALMEDFLRRHSVPTSKNPSAPVHSYVGPPQMQDSRIPVAVSAFDIPSLSGQILRTGSLARAARASATFPFLFQPVGYHDTNSHRRDKESGGNYYLLIDGGLTDFAGLQGTRDVLSRMARDGPARHTIINLSVGDFLGSPPGPTYFDAVNGTSLVVSISLQHLPACGPWAMSNGPRAVEASLKAMQASLDVPLFLGRDPNHYELHIDTRGFWKQG